MSIVYGRAWVISPVISPTQCIHTPTHQVKWAWCGVGADQLGDFVVSAWLKDAIHAQRLSAVKRDFLPHTPSTWVDQGACISSPNVCCEHFDGLELCVTHWNVIPLIKIILIMESKSVHCYFRSLVTILKWGLGDTNPVSLCFIFFPLLEMSYSWDIEQMFGSHWWHPPQLWPL